MSDMYGSDTSDREIERSKPRPYSIEVQECYDLESAIDVMHGNNPIPAGNADGEAHVHEKRFAKTMQKVRNAAPKRYSVTTQVPTIYRVPDELRRHDRGQDYLPVAVYIGGFARKNMRKTYKLEEYKWCCVRQLISRHTRTRLLEPDKTRVLLLGCLKSIKRLLPRIRASYAQAISTNDDELAEMMLLDGCFILHRLLKYARGAAAERGGDQLREEEDNDWTQVFGQCWVWQSATRDLLLLENQIPFFVLQEFFEQLRNFDEPKAPLVTGGLRLFRSLRPQMMHRSPIGGDDVHHLLHLFYLSVGFEPSDVPKRYRHQLADVFLPELPQWVPCARELEEAGVRFRKRKNATSFLDIRFDFRRGVLEIPPLQLYDSSSALFRNLIAFEQVYPDTRWDVSTYAVFMDCLINTPEDMRILHLRGILVNQMNGEQDASRFFSQICAQVHWSADNYLVGLMGEVSKYKDSRRHKWRAALVRNYFSNPWLVISVLAAVLLIAMTALQTFFTVYPYFKPAK